MREETNYNKFCAGKDCPEYIRWSFDVGSDCESCKLIGQSYNIDEYPSECLFLEEIKGYLVSPQTPIEPWQNIRRNKLMNVLH